MAFETISASADKQPLHATQHRMTICFRESAYQPEFTLLIFHEEQRAHPAKTRSLIPMAGKIYNRRPAGP